MHPSLNIPEIATLIAEQGIYDTDPLLRKGILSLARTCQRLYEPVTNVVWRRIPSLRPLVYSISPEVWASAKGNLIGGTEFRTISHQDLVRLRLNARRVRIFGVEVDVNNDEHSTADEDQLHPDVLRILSLVHADSALLPCLQEAIFYKPKADVLPFMHLVTPSTMKKLSITLATEDVSNEDVFSYLSFLNSVGHRYPLLEGFRLTLDQRPTIGVSPSVIANIFASDPWRHLSSLRIYGQRSSYRTLIPFFHSINLRSIVIDFPLDEEFPHRFSQNTAPPVFPSMENMSLEFGSMSQATNFFDALHDRMPLRAVSVFVVMSTPSPPIGLRKICQCVSSSVRTARDLEELLISERYQLMEEARVLPHLLSPKELQPLQAFTSLRRIKILSCSSFLAFRDNDLRQLAMAWPLAREITLLGLLDPVAREPQKVTLNGLAHFARFCPNLVFLKIEINATICSTSLPGQKPPIRGFALRNLDVRLSHIGNPYKVAAFVSDMFPKLKQVTSTWEETGDVPRVDSQAAKRAAKAWRKVSNIVKIFARVRREEAVRWVDDSHSSDAGIEF